MIKRINVREMKPRVPTHFHILKQDPVAPSIPAVPREKPEKVPATPDHQPTQRFAPLTRPVPSPATPRSQSRGRKKRSCHKKLRFVAPGIKCSQSNMRQHSSKRHQTSKNRYVPIRIDTKQELRDRTSHRSLLQDKVLQLSRPDLKEFMVQKKYIRRDCTAPLSVLQNIFLQSRAMGSIRIERE